MIQAATNRDPAANSEPARFDLRRQGPRCFTLGAGGHALGVGLDMERAAAEVGHLALTNARIPRFGRADARPSS